MQPSVSIIIPAFNEEALLPLCLASLRALDNPKELVEHCPEEKVRRFLTRSAEPAEHPA